MSANGEKANSPLGKDARLRKAFELSIDRNVINRVAFNGEYTADNQMIPPSDPFYSKAHPVPARDVAAAKALMARSGRDQRAGRDSPSKTPSRMPASPRSSSPWRRRRDSTSSCCRSRPRRAIQRYLAGNFEMYIGNWSGRGDPDPTLYAFFSCDGGQNVNKYCNKDLESVLNAARVRGRCRQAQGSSTKRPRAST